MKKKSLLLVLLAFVFMLTLPLQAEVRLGDNLIQHGDFEFNTGTELRFPDPVFSAAYGVAHNWGSLSFDSAAMAVVDPDDETNTVLKLSLSDSGQNWSSFFRFLPIQPSTVYDISIDFKIVGTTDNLGMRFAGAPSLELVFLNHASKTAIPGKTDWYNVQFQFDTAAGSYDSIAIWFNTMASADNYALLDNISIEAVSTDVNINVGGDFEGFLDYAPQAILEATPSSYGFYGSNGVVGNGNATLNTAGVLGYVVDTLDDVYQVEFDFTIADLTNANVGVFFETETTSNIGRTELVQNGVIVSSLVTENAGVYHVLAQIDKLAATSLAISYGGDSQLVIDNLSLKLVQTIPDNPFDPDTTYYPGSNLIINGNFEAFAVDTVFSETQLEGAWGSINLDGPAKIASVDGSKVMSVGKTTGKTYSSSFVITPPELEVGDLLRFSYDYKVDAENALSTYIALNSAFVGVSNTSYYTINFADLEDGDLTAGAELLTMPLVITDKANGWKNVQLDFEVTADLLVKCNSIRWLFTPQETTDRLLIDNVFMAYLTDEEPVVNVTSLVIPEGDQELNIGDVVQLSVNILPTDAVNKTVSWTSSNTAVATVDSTGKVTAIASGACTITVKNFDNTITDNVVVTVLQVITEPTGPSIGLVVGIVSGSAAVLAGAIFVFLRFRKPRI